MSVFNLYQKDHKGGGVKPHNPPPPGSAGGVGVGRGGGRVGCVWVVVVDV